MREVDVFVIGSGPAGLSAAQYTARANRSTLVIGNEGAGGKLNTIAHIENYPGYPLSQGIKLAEDLEAQALRFGVEIDFDEAKKIEKTEDGKFYIKTQYSEYIAKAIIIATGCRHSKLGIPGEEEYSGKGVSYCATCDGPFFKKKVISVVGGGDTALSDAIYLSTLASEINLIHRREEFRAQAVYQDRVKNRSNINLHLKKQVSEVIGDGEKVTSLLLDDGTKLSTDALFIFTGIIPNSDIFSSLVKLDDSGFIITDDAMNTSMDGIFAAGDIRNTTFRQVVTACGDGAIAAHSVDKYINKNFE